MDKDKEYAVRAARCRHTAANEEVYETLRRITDPLTRSWEKLEKADRIAMVDRYRGNFVYLQDGKVIWDGPDPSHLRSHRDFGGGSKPGSARWLKLVDPEETEGERFEVYDDCLQRMRA